MPSPEQLPAWIDKIPSLLGGGVIGALGVAYLNYKAALRGHDVADGHNEDTHNENLISTLLVRIHQLETTAAEAAKDYIEMQKSFLELYATHQQCEANIRDLNTKVQSLVDGQARAELRHAEKERDYQEAVRKLEGENRDYVALNNHLTTTMRAEDIEAKVEANTQKIKETEERL